MSVLLEQTLPRTLDLLLARAERERPRRIEAWLFEDEASRRAAERRLQGLGIAARLRSAYKPLLHAFLEEFGLEGHRQVRIELPAAALRRLKVEAYPLAGLLGSARLEFVAVDQPDPSQLRVLLDGKPRAVWVPMDERFSPIAWLRLWQDERLSSDAPLDSEYQQVFRAVLAAVEAWRWPASAPYFEQLLIDIRTPGIERLLPVDNALISSRDALHEDLFFTLRESFQRRAGVALGERLLRPGQIIPRIVAGEGDTQVRVQLGRAAADDFAERALPALARLEHGLHPAELSRLLAGLQGRRFGCRSAQGRPVEGLYRPGSQPGLVISAGQHGNESSGVVGALRAAIDLQQRPEAHYALVALENPDGAALHQRLSLDNPRHILHAARLTAWGDDLESRSGTDLGEKAAREQAIALSAAGLHISLHGYPAHEWTRPFSGYLPPRAEDWALPKGLFLILRQHPGLDGRLFLRALSAALAQDPALREYNARQQALWRAHWGELPYPLFNGIPCLISEDSRSSVPFTLISEIPDETLVGASFRFAQHTQMRVVLLAAELYWQGLLGEVGCAQGSPSSRSMAQG